MTCPRCGQKLPPASVSRCPSCGQPLYAPVKHPSRITRLASTSTLAPIPESESPPLPLDADEAWPDLTTPRLGEPEASWRESASSFRPPSRPSTWLLMPPLRERPQQLVGILVAAALILVVISGGTLVLVNSLRHHGTASHAPTPNTVQGANATSTAAASTSGLPTATAAQSPTTQRPTAAPTSAPHLVTIFSDPLTSNTNGWPVQNGCAFAGGGYSVSSGTRCLAPVTANDAENISVQMMSTTSNFQRVGIDFRIASGGGGDPQYSYYIYSSGTCVAIDEGADITLFNNTACSAIAQGRNAVNTLTIHQSGAHMDFYVNGTLVGSANDGTLTTGGIALEVHRGGPVVFTNFVLTTVQ